MLKSPTRTLIKSRTKAPCLSCETCKKMHELTKPSENVGSAGLPHTAKVLLILLMINHYKPQKYGIVYDQF